MFRYEQPQEEAWGGSTFVRYRGPSHGALSATRCGLRTCIPSGNSSCECNRRFLPLSSRSCFTTVESLDPGTIEDARKRTLASIVQRQGQGLFRRRLLEAYGRRCAITGCATEAVLEAVHITPYLGKATNDLTNGLLLRSDLHTLFDLGLIGVAPSTFALVLSQSLRNGDYARYAGKPISVPRQPSDQPAERALKQHLAKWKLAI